MKSVEFCAALLRISLRIDHQMTTGRNSADAQISLAEALIRIGELEEARTWLDEASARLELINNQFEIGCLWSCRARLAWADGKSGTLPPTEAYRLTEDCLIKSRTAFLSSKRNAWRSVDATLERLQRTGEFILQEVKQPTVERR
jgi:hypothetical protein